MAVYRIRKDSLYLYEIPFYGSSRLGVVKENKFLKVKTAQNNTGVMSLPIPVNIAQSKNATKQSIYPLGRKHYESTDWLGNVRVTYTDKKSWQQNKFALNVSSTQDYYPFGSVMEGRKYNLTAYRYAFNTQERMPELNESHYTALYWEYDGRLARRWNRDPKPIPTESEYAVLGNNPLWYTDVLGDYKLKVKLSKETKSSLKKQAKEISPKGWRDTYRKFKEERVEFLKQYARERIAEGEEAVLSSEENIKNFEIITGAKPGSELWQDYFEENGRGPKVILDENIGNSGVTSGLRRTITIGTPTGKAGHTEETFRATYIHELAHWASFYAGVEGDYTAEGYKGLTFRGRPFGKVSQIYVFNKVVSELKKHDNIDSIIKKDYEEDSQAKRIEGGYVLEYLIFGKITHLPKYSITE
ncbi:MAG: hypothetical protein KatS3mg087_2000 [Patescibacteria group bacterium]|nr:MAG: hypothetical protein KatS3mg087_2000 [Patescibacteria group bacterium]